MTRKYNQRPYTDRDERNAFIADELTEYIGSSVINIGGGGKKFLKKYLSQDTSYFEIDIDGEPDLKIDIDTGHPLPIEDNTYETVICTEVLEHLNNFHHVFGELIRISERFIIISLPNSVMSFYSYLRNKPCTQHETQQSKHFGRFRKFYGLPLEQPFDRHKWFFSYTEAEEFIFYQSEKYGLFVKEMFGIGYYHERLNRKIVRILLSILKGNNFRKNFACSTLWCVLEKGTYNKLKGNK